MRAAQEKVLNDTTSEFLRGIFDKLHDARTATTEATGKGLDIKLIRTDTSVIGKYECYKLRFTPSFLDASETRQSENREHIKQLVIEVPKFFNGNIPELVFTTLTKEDGTIIHHAITQHRILEVDPHDDDIEPYIGAGGKMIIYRTSDLRGIKYYEDLEKATASEDELAERLKYIILYNDIVHQYLIANQSRNDGTA